MIDRDHLFHLFDRYMRKTGTPSEKEELFRLLADPLYEPQLREISESYTALPFNNTMLDGETTEAVWEAIRKGAAIDEKSGRGVVVFRRWWAAAAVLLILTGGATWFWLKHSSEQNIVAVPVKKIVPGTNGAVLTLADGRTILLDSTKSGTIAQQHGSDVLLNNGQLLYDTSGNALHTLSAAEIITYNIVTTPRGRQFKLLLPDGTRVWLNAASSLRFPTAFTGTNRRVEVSGEAYFEVAPDAQKPFLVNINDQVEIQVLGTHFNVNAYNDEPAVTTTLLEGKVNVLVTEPETRNPKPVILNPGEACVLAQGKPHVSKVDTEAAVAWINGMFNFKSADLQMVLRQVARWYDVEIKYDGKINARFSGSVYRSENFYELIRLIEFASNVQFTVNQKTITVSPKP